MGIFKASTFIINKYSTRLAIKKQQNKIESQYLVDTWRIRQSKDSFCFSLLLSFPNLLPLHFNQSSSLYACIYRTIFIFHSNPFNSIPPLRSQKYCHCCEESIPYLSQFHSNVVYFGATPTDNRPNLVNGSIKSSAAGIRPVAILLKIVSVPSNTTSNAFDTI